MALDVLFHFALEVAGGFGLRCAIGMCEHKRHQYLVWLIFGLALSFLTVQVIG